MKKTILRRITKSLSMLAASALVLGTFGAVAPLAFAATAPTTGTPTNITTSDATLNGTNGDTAATASSFWVSTSTFSTATPTLPAGVYSTADLGPQAVGAAYAAALSSTVGLPTVTADTTYYYAAWTDVGGTWSPGSIVQFTTVSSPTITSANPASGSTAGGTAITITGTEFNSGASVMIGGAAATNVVVASSTSITATTPAGTAGSQNVVVTNTDGGTTTSTGAFTYMTPVNSSVTTTPASSVTSTDATLNGLMGASAATGHSFWVSTSTFSTASATIPAGVYSTADLGPIAAATAFSAALSSATGLPTVTASTTYYFAAWANVGGMWSPGAVLSFTTASSGTALAPTVSSIAPTSGTTAGGTSVTITGTGFTGATAVHFGSSLATITGTTSSTSITATSPATTTAGIVDVTVTTPAGSSATSSADHYTYQIGGTVTGGTQPGGTLAVTSITPVQTSGTADGTYANGWSYIFNITVPTSEPNLSMEFSNWLDSASDTIPVAGNMQISSAQASNTAPVTISAANTFSSPLHMIGNLSTSTPGLHVQVLVQVKIPLNTVNGSYTTNYGVQTLQ
ncbi:MAG: IPT/TIG domain-containing protein [Candidatus Pacebacteria bacterium]|nr:IPT/TIG domain-containing protein [Candidatus Paceibacterota bacterium]